MNSNSRAPLSRRLAIALGLCSLNAFAPAGLLQAAELEENAVAATTNERNPTTLPVVVVTAEKANRSLQDTPASVQVLNARDLETRAGLTTIRDVLASTPNVVLVGTGNTAPAIRGVDGTGASQGSDAFIAGSRSRINMQIDGRPVSYNEIVFGDSLMWDVKQVEVLRGAQSTLQGRNAIAGTIVTKTNDPTYETEGAVRVAAGNYDQRRASATLSGPISDDSAAFRLAADWMEKTSFIDGWESYKNVDDPADFEALNVRAKLLLEPKSIENWRTLVTLNHADYQGPQTENVDYPFDKFRSSYAHYPVFEPRSHSAIVDTAYELNPELTLEGLATVTDLNVKRRADPGDGIANIDNRDDVIEPRLRFHSETYGTGVVGLHHYASNQDETLDLAHGLAFHDHIRTVAIFGENTLPLNSSFDLIFGARYEEEKHERGGGNGASVIVSLDETYEAFLPKLGVAFHVNENSTVGATVSRGYNGGGAGAAYDEEREITTNYQYDPEYVWTYEIFGRQQLLDGRLRLTENVFYSDYKDMQLTYDLTPEDVTDYSSVVTNADKVKTYGAEFSINWLAMRTLELYGTIGTLKTDISKYPDSGYQGNELQNSPALTASAGVTWNWREWDANLSTRYSDSYYSDIDNLPRAKVDPYTVTDLQIGRRFANLRVYATVDNVFDSDKALAIYPGETQEEDTANILTPRSYWVGAELTF